MHTPVGLESNFFLVLDLPTYPVQPRNQAHYDKEAASLSVAGQPQNVMASSDKSTSSYSNRSSPEKWCLTGSALQVLSPDTACLEAMASFYPDCTGSRQALNKKVYPPILQISVLNNISALVFPLRN